MNVGSVFSGIGLLDYGLCLAGLQHAWFCEADPWRREILRTRWPGVPVHDDIRTLGAANARRVDVVAGGFPCKGASTAGKRNGFDHPETVLWREMFRAIRELRPRYALVENVANLLALHRGAVWGEVLADLASIGYDTSWDCLPAAAFGAPHLRDRVFAIARNTDRMAGTEAESGRGRPGEVAQPGAVERAQRSDRDAAADASEGGRGEGQRELRTGEPDVDRGAPAGPQRNGVRPQQEPEPRGGGEAIAGSAREAAPDTAGQRRQGTRPERSPLVRAAADRGVSADWREYEPAIHRWESVTRPAPEPLVRRVNDRSASRVERSRLSALGDGVQVQAGQCVGRYLLELERRGAVAA